MAPSTLRRVPINQHEVPRTAERKSHIEGTSVVSPTSPPNVETPSTIGQLTPTRRMLFERRAVRESSYSHHHQLQHQHQQSMNESPESREESEIEDLRIANKRKEEKLKVLHRRFQNIQEGLGSIDQERHNLVEKAKRLEKEKRHIQKQLELREREIAALVKRCASQEEKMRESSRLRAQNKELTVALESAQNQLTESDQERQDLQLLRNQLQESELAREELQDRLRKVQREHDCIADTLQECLANIRKLTEEKEQIEADRRRERKLAEIEMEKQRLIHVQESNLWKENMESKQMKIDQMERILQENLHAKTSLRREHAIREEEVKSAIEKYEEKIAALEEELNRRSGDGDEDYESTLLLLQSKIEEKEALMAGLKDEFSGQMGELMKTQSSLDEAEEEKKTLASKVEQLERLECEYSALQEYVRVLDSNLADLTSENAYLSLDKDSLEEETKFLHQKVKELELELTRSQQHRMEWIGGTNIQGERDELQKALANARNEVASLQSELAMRAQAIAKLEGEIEESRQLILRKDEEIQKLNLDLEEKADSLRSSLSEARHDVTQLNMELELREKQLKMLEHELESERNERLQQVLKLKDIERTLSISPAGNENGYDSLESQSGKAASTDYSANQKIDFRAQEAVNQINLLKDQITHLKLDVDTQRQSKEEVLRQKQVVDISLQEYHNELKSIQEEVERLRSINSQLVGETEASRMCLAHSKDEAERSKSQSERLQDELNDALENLKETEGTIERMEAERDALAKERSQLLDMLEEARETIDSIESRLTDPTESSLEEQLKTALADLVEQQTKMQNLEDQYHAAIDMQSRGEMYNREALSKIAILENQLMELQEQQDELRRELNHATALTDSQDKQIQEFQKEKLEWEQQSKVSNDQCERERATSVSLEQELTKTRKLNALLKVELDDSTKKLLSYEQRIQSLDEALARNEMLRADLESKISDNASRMESLEHEITSFRIQESSLDNQLKTALKNLSEKDASLKDTEMKLVQASLAFSNATNALEREMKSKTEVEEKLAACQTELSSHEALVATHAQKVTSLEKDLKVSNDERDKIGNEKFAMEKNVQALEKEFLERLSSSEDQYRTLSSQHSEVCQKLADKQKLVESLEEYIRVRAIEMDEVKLQLSDHGEEIKLLEQEIVDRGLKIQGLEHEVEILTSNNLEHAFSESEEKRQELEKQLQTCQATINELTRTLYSRDSRVDELDQQLLEATKEKLMEHERADKASQACLDLEERITELNALVASNEAKSIAILDELADTKKAKIEKEIEAENLQELITSLESTIIAAQNNALATEEEHTHEINEERKRNAEAFMKLVSIEAELTEEKQRISRYEGMLSEREDTISSLRTQYEGMLSEREDTISSLRKELNQTIETMESEFRKKEAVYKADLAKLETRVALKDDEIQELRVIELKDKEEAIASLSDALDEVKGQSQAKETQMMNAFNALKRENEILKVQINDHTRAAHMNQQAYTDQINRMQEQIRELETSKEKVAARLREQEMELQEERSNLSSQLKKREAELEQQGQALISSQEQWKKTEADTQDELSRMKMALDLSIVRSQEDLNKQREVLEGKHRLVVTEMSSKLRTVEKKLSETDTVLRERTSLLSEMVEHNKDLESRLDKQQAQISAMEAENRRYSTDLSETQRELHRVREDLTKRENGLLAKLNEERIHRDNAERALSKLKVQVADATAAKKAVADLERDNQVLKDKITRQEAYLQRKLQKEKIQRGGRASTGNGTASNSGGSVCPTPPKPSRTSPVRILSNGTSMIPTISHDHSNRSSRSISGSTLARSSIPSIRTSKSSEV